MRRWMASAVVAGFTSLACVPAGAGTLNVVGTGDGIDMMRSLAAVFTADNPAILVNVPPSIGSGGAVAAVGADKEPLGRVARPLSAAESAQGLIYTPVVRIPSAIMVHPSTGVKGLTSAQLAGIYAGDITNWKEVGGADLRIKVVRREDADSTLGVLRASMPGWKDLVITPKSKTAVTTQEAYDTVRDVEGSIGFGPYSKQLEPSVAVLAIDGKRISDRDYPSAVTLAFIHKTATLTPDAKAFLDFVRTDKARHVLSNMGGTTIHD